MGQTLWTAVDAYISEHISGDDPVLEAAVAASNAAGLPALNVAPNQGKLLQLLARCVGARRILEIGTLGGYSTIWLARALPADGHLISLELDARHAEVARSNIERAALTERVQIRLGAALDTLPLLQKELEAPFCFTFIDADKANIPEYFDWAVKLSRPGAMIVVDNVVRKGALIDAHSGDENVVGVRRLHEALANDQRVSATTLQTVGVKGYDGLTLAVVN
jgi:predicted O-methyltransferase YrrM